MVSSGNTDNSRKQTPNSTTRHPTSAQDTGDTAAKDPTGTPPEDPEILQEAGETTEKSNAPEGDAEEISQDYTLSEEGEGDNIGGNKELRNEEDNEDENNSKKTKGPLYPPTAQ